MTGNILGTAVGAIVFAIIWYLVFIKKKKDVPKQEKVMELIIVTSLWAIFFNTFQYIVDWFLT
ncbi:LPXTG-motif cell wall-anchored protein [Desulfitispora alkaliphila]|uniref:LPXTG cell wall anchor domain-containing protein n=1 Tax=Desulfitispora alkaliphila TaxID=622674 RepID=UPI003D1A60A0